MRFFFKFAAGGMIAAAAGISSFAQPALCQDAPVPPMSTAGASKAFNPDTSVNFLGYYRKETLGKNSAADRNADFHNGFGFEEAEMQFFSDVDPYFTANALFSLAPDGSGAFGLDPEEVFFETIFLPMVTIRAGKFKAALGKHNTLHTHAYPFIDAPLINQDLLGPEGLNEVGVSVSILLPTDWYSEFILQGLNNSNENLYNSHNAGDVAGVAEFRNLWDLNDDLTLELAPFGTVGKNQYAGTSSLYGSDLIFKWRPAVGGKYKALIFANEYLNGHIGNRPAGEQLGGFASWLQYQFAERWWIQGRAEYEGLPHSATLPVKRKQSVLLAFLPSEFSGFRLQYDHLLVDNQPTDHAVTLQWNITIGAHPAHSY